MFQQCSYLYQNDTSASYVYQNVTGLPTIRGEIKDNFFSVAL